MKIPSRQGSIGAAFKGADGKTFYPFHLWANNRMVSLSLLWLQRRAPLQNEQARQRLLDSLEAIVGAMTTKNLTGFPSFKVALLANPHVAAQVEAWLSAAVAQLR